MRARHILLKTPLLVPEIQQALNNGQDFSQLARQYSACPSKDNGGDWGVLGAEALPRSIIEALENTQVGEVCGPIETRHGLHLIKLDSL